MKSTTNPPRQKGISPTYLLLLLSVISRLLPLFLLTVLSNLPQFPPFDSSHTVLTQSESSPYIPTSYGLNGSGTIRWDAIHFLSIAKDGYRWEQQLAFQPGWMAILRISGLAVSYIRNRFIGFGDEPDGFDEGLQLSPWDLEVGGMIVSNLCFVGATIMLYRYGPISLLQL